MRLLALLLACCLLPAQDGPYVQWQGRRAEVFRLKEGQLERQELKAPLRLPELPQEALTGRPPAPDPDSFPAPPKILALSDIHGHLDETLVLLKAHGVVDARGRWRYGRGHLVIAGDVVDRGQQVCQALWYLRGLETEARRAGGRVHLLLGNHEAMVAAGDLRYTAPLYTAAPAGMPDVVARFGPDSEFGRWLRAKPALLKLGPFLFLHGGVSPDFLARGFTLARANALLRAHLGEPGRGEDEASFLLGAEGPLWYRGYFPGEADPASEAQIDATLARFHVKAIVVGHTTRDQIEALHAGRVYAIDAALKEARGEAWIWERGRIYRGLKDGSRVELGPE